jgi:hypothetical protein
MDNYSFNVKNFPMVFTLDFNIHTLFLTIGDSEIFIEDFFVISLWVVLEDPVSCDSGTLFLPHFDLF